MLTSHKVTHTFPSITLASRTGGLPVEVSLIAQLVPGSGNHLYASVTARQQAHDNFIDSLDEPSTKLHGTDFAKGDLSSLYSFAVGPQGHPFHQHAGQRLFTAISGSSGAQLRFSSAGLKEIQADPQAFVDALHMVNIPPDCLFTVRFGGETWHQFAPLKPNAGHPAFFALSCHINELGGIDDEAARAAIIANQATIPSLTTLLPENVLALLRTRAPEPSAIPTTALALNVPQHTLQHTLCQYLRQGLGRVLGAWGRWRKSTGFQITTGLNTFGLDTNTLNASRLPELPAHSLLQQQFQGQALHHEDVFALRVARSELPGGDAAPLLAAVLESFMRNPPQGVTRLMQLRNKMVRPWGLRTSSLGCPVSSLLSSERENLFAGRFPVLAQAVSATRAQVLLGADDKHLRFRSVVGVEIIDQNVVQITLGTRVQCKNRFGRLYMALIHGVHLGYIVPAMLEGAVGKLLPAGKAASVAAGAAASGMTLANVENH